MSQCSTTPSPSPAASCGVRADHGLDITVVAGTGEGATPLSAFDAALFQCGAPNYNLIPLSSVIPPQSVVQSVDLDRTPTNQHGHRLFVVMAKVGAATTGTTVAAGLGWMQWEDGRGVFVEHTLCLPPGAASSIEPQLTDLILASLNDLATRRGVPFRRNRAGVRLATIQVNEQPACAVVLARYQAEPWSQRSGEGMEHG